MIPDGRRQPGDWFTSSTFIPKPFPAPIPSGRRRPSASAPVPSPGGDVAVGDAQRALDVRARLGIQRVGPVGLLERVWDLRNNLTTYDPTYVVAAEALDCPLLTADARLARAPGPGPECPITVVTD